ncbi:uncharacterized protein METZ01_LOCUS226239 [marine metagenome]|uniref:Uncharacterized protein n=1 Tax=marine metagenome TaxID=408172 RepID=A0A382GF73_9ZZZZ
MDTISQYHRRYEELRDAWAFLPYY